MNHHHDDNDDEENSAGFEAQLHRQAQAEPDPAWREDILGAALASLPANADAAVAAIEEPDRPRFSFRLWLREWLPMPLRVPLAAAWLLIGFFAASSQQPGAKQSANPVVSVKSAKSNVAAPASLLAFRQRLSLFGSGNEDLIFSHHYRLEDL